MSRNRKLKKRAKNQFRVSLLAAAAFLASLIIIFCIGLNTTTNASAENDTANKTKCYKSITVESGDTLWTIADTYADAYGCSTKEYVKEIRQINGLHGDYLKSGNKLIIVFWAET